MRLITIALILVAAFWAAMPAAHADEAADEAYRAAVAAARQAPDLADYAKLRELYVASRYFPKGSGVFRIRQGKAVKAFEQSGNKDEAAILVFADEHFANIAAHALVLNTLGSDQKTSDLHRKAFIGLIKAMVAKGDGKSRETAIPVLSGDEEYVMLSVMGLQSSEQAFIEHDGRQYDVLTGKPKQGAAVQRWFDITAFFGGDGFFKELGIKP
jgi:hypothetical protein